MATPARPRQSGIPGPGRMSAIPTPGRSRSSSSVYNDDTSQALADALKANDPLHHQNPSLPNSASLSPQSITPSSSGSRSVGRPPSAPAPLAKVQERSKTPSSARPPSRPPSRQLELHRPSRTFEVGDNVRIESLGFEGALRFMGAIDGKPGLWAGVELSGGFTGKGKNNGSVGGKQYFVCPDKCGVFVAATKLSPPTVGPGATQRPSSAASSRGGRSTPAAAPSTGRATPSVFSTSRTPSASFSNGRTTPSYGGRVTPSFSSGRITPGSASMQKPFRTPSTKLVTAPLSDKITTGSRASKYMTMTAKQLSSTPAVAEPETDAFGKGGPNSLASSPSVARTLSSPTRPPASPFATPRAGHSRLSNAASPTPSTSRGRTSLSTPRNRIPSGVAMPPPSSPASLKEADPPNHVPLVSPSVSTSGATLSRPTSSASQRSGGTEELPMLEQLQSRLDAAEYENERLRAAADPGAAFHSSPLIEQLQVERQEALEKYVELQGRFTILEERLVSQANDLRILREEKDGLLVKLSDVKSQQQQALAARQSDVEAREAEIKSLHQRLSELERINAQKDHLIADQTLKIEELSDNLQKLHQDFEDEKRELVTQVDELRLAGQETIALYEDRLSTANTQRYELEQRVLSLESTLNFSETTNVGQKSLSDNFTSSATQIDNEALQEQVQHLQKKTTRLEEQLEEARATLERDVASYQDKITRIRSEEEQRKRDLVSKTRELEELSHSEARARNRVEEIEEALRESTVALENTRGEVESLRSELANLEVLFDDVTEGDISSKVANFTKKLSADRSHYQREIKRLEQDLLDSRTENGLLLQKLSHITDSIAIEDAAPRLEKENQVLKDQIDELKAKLSISSRALEDRDELNSSRKKANRDFMVPNALDSAKPLPTRSEPSTEEVAGLKHIVQELQKENLASAQHIKLLESENSLLSAEAEQLRQEVRVIGQVGEGKIQISIAQEPGDQTNFSQPAVESRLLVEADLDQMRKRLSDVEMKHARIVHDLNKEISELEALVESKIYREDELEQEIERLKDKLARQKKTSKNGGNDTPDNRRRQSGTTSGESANLESKEVCEICERPGHDIFNCSLLKDDAVRTRKDLVVCEDCESPGHVAADCPHSSDVF